LFVTVQQLDTTDDTSVREAFARAGRVDLLVNNAAVVNFGSVEETPLDDWRQMLDTNLLGTVRCMQAALPGMRTRRSGRIINITTVAVPAAFPGTGAYAASKAAIEQISEVAAIEAHPHGVQVIIVELGVIGTNMQPTGTPPPADSPYWSTMRNTVTYLAVNAPYASHPAVAADTIATAAREANVPLRITTGHAGRATVELRRQHSDADWRDFLGTQRFLMAYRPPEHSEPT
jgi:NAD(P)-dependent dehydrogenase (short-subunit alcohol dehydrogenase family)